MQIVIEIDEKTYAIAKRHGLYGYPHLSRAIENGKPLPKGHGRLIDADDLWDAYQDLDYDFYEAMDVAKTILEADKESENGK